MTLSSSAILAAIASVSFGGCAASGAQQRTETMSPASMYQLCSDVQFQCIPARLHPTTEQAPLRVDTNLTTQRRSNLG